MTRSQLHQLVDQLPEQHIESVGEFLLTCADAVRNSMDSAPEDDEPYTAAEQEESRTAWEEAQASWKECASIEDVMARFSIEPASF